MKRRNDRHLSQLRHLIKNGQRRDSLEIFHEQLPLPVPCYDLPPVIEFAVGPHEVRLWAPPTPLG